MQAKDYFRRVAAAEADLQRLQAVRTHYEDLGLSITSHWGPVTGGGSPGGSRIETAVVGMVDAEGPIMERIRDCRRLIAEAERVIALMPTDKFRQLLTLRYIAGWTLRSVSDELGYKAEPSIYRAHRYALAEAQKVMKGMNL